tara:strand:- start:508 stop:813 length:306 start_codon:yes stop_codon:yes gene_type:complete
MRVTVHAMQGRDEDAWVVDIPNHITRTGKAKLGQGWNEALYTGLVYMSNNGHDTVYIYTTNRDTVMADGYSKMFKMISWNYITAQQVDINLRQRVYDAMWA